MKISYAVTVCNELVEIQTLLPFLIASKQQQDEIVVLFDSKNGTQEVKEYLESMSTPSSKLKWFSYDFDGHFANMKNRLTQECSGDYIFQIDADEIPQVDLMVNKKILFVNLTKSDLSSSNSVYNYSDSVTTNLRDVNSLP